MLLDERSENFYKNGIYTGGRLIKLLIIDMIHIKIKYI